jgi:2-dehydro-3-deoxyphosphogluconate aldolase/(4S)-4-hydroxy-2-oxoglutarate aldolase
MTASFGRTPVPEQISGPGVIAIGRGLDPATVPAIAEALYAGGVRAFELTLNSDRALQAIEALAACFPDGQLLMGAGTVLDRAGADAALAAGARFLVMPHAEPELVAWLAPSGVPVFPGAMTPSEILAVWRAGAAAVKVFPASVLGPAFVREFRGPFRDVPLIPTGGVGAEGAADFVAAGAVAVGLGSWLTGSGQPELISARAAQLTSAVAAARAG